jgi:hypothetical protein
MASIESALTDDEDAIVAEVDAASARPIDPDCFWWHAVRARDSSTTYR